VLDCSHRARQSDTLCGYQSMKNWGTGLDNSNRRIVMKSTAATAAASLIPSLGWAQSAAPDALMQKIVEVELRLKSRLGVVLHDLETGKKWMHRADERFAMCSTFKGIAGAAVLALVDQGREDIDRRIVIRQSDIQSYAPVTQDRVGGSGMTIGELCEATITTSDNTAGNLVLKVIGGPQGFTKYVQSIGDTVTRLDRTEPDLNEAKPGDARDTTTAAALTLTMQKLVLGDVLSVKSRELLTNWLVGNKVGDTKVRAGLPKDWRVADKTGGGGFGTNNDTGVIWPPNRKPILFTILTTETSASTDDKNAGMADIARSLKSVVPG
jgi:beta-lactamase class A